MTCLDKFTGCLVGLATGDGLGAPIEEINFVKKNYPPPEKRPVYDMIGGGAFQVKPGQITDDTERTLNLARSLVACKGFNHEEIAQRDVQWVFDSAIGSGSTTRAALQRIKEGYSVYEAAQCEKCLNSLGNGTIMSCAPIGLYDCKHADQLEAHSRDYSRITHPHPDCVDSCVFLTTLITSLINGKDKQLAFESALYATKGNAVLYHLYYLIPISKDYPHVNGEVKATIITATHAVLSTNTFEDAVLKAVNMGGDADTRGAVAGAIAGSLYGEKAIPEKWKTKLQDRHGHPIHHELASLAAGLYELAQR